MSSDPLPPLNTLGWYDRNYHDPDVVQLRERLKREAGVPGLEVVDPAVPGFALRAAELYNRDGYVVVRDVLDAARLRAIRSGCERVVHEMVARDANRMGNRGSHRYSFGAAHRALGYHDAWAALIDPPVLLEVLAAIFETDAFACTAQGGGDFCLPGATEFQHLHADFSGRQDGAFPDVLLGTRLADGFTFSVPLDADLSLLPASSHGESTFKRVNMRDLPCSHFLVNVNFPMELGPGAEVERVGHSAINGATRQIPGTHHSHERIPKYSDELQWMKMSMTCPAPAGCALLRDWRAWHGGTPNVGSRIRAIPQQTYMAPRRHPLGCLGIKITPILPRSTFETLSEAGRRICEQAVAEPGAPGEAEAWADRRRRQWEDAFGASLGLQHTAMGFKNTGNEKAVVARL